MSDTRARAKTAFKGMADALTKFADQTAEGLWAWTLAFHRPEDIGDPGAPKPWCSRCQEAWPCAEWLRHQHQVVVVPHGEGADRMSETTAPTVTLVEFLEARLDEAEADARLAGGDRWILDGNSIRRETHATDEVVEWPYDETARHIARNDPAQVLTDIQVKRRILELHRPVDGNRRCRCCLGTLDPLPPGPQYPCETLRLLALPYAGHPDYNPDWRP